MAVVHYLRPRLRPLKPGEREGKCGVCGYWHRLNGNGDVRKHRSWNVVLIKWDTCHGSATKPAETDEPNEE